MEWVNIESVNFGEITYVDGESQLKWYGNVYYRIKGKEKVYEVILTLSPEKQVYACGGGKTNRTVLYRQLIQHWDEIQVCLRKHRLEYATGDFAVQDWDGGFELNDVSFVYPNKTYFTVQEVINRKED